MRLSAAIPDAEGYKEVIRMAFDVKSLVGDLTAAGMVPQQARDMLERPWKCVGGALALASLMPGADRQTRFRVAFYQLQAALQIIAEGGEQDGIC